MLSAIRTLAGCQGFRATHGAVAAVKDSAACEQRGFRALRSAVAPAPPKAAGAVSKGLSHVRKAFQSKERLRWLLAPLRNPWYRDTLNTRKKSLNSLALKQSRFFCQTDDSLFPTILSFRLAFPRLFPTTSPRGDRVAEVLSLLFLFLRRAVWKFAIACLR